MRLSAHRRRRPAIKYHGALLCRDARLGIGDGQASRSVGHPGASAQGGSRWRVVAGIVHQIFQHAPHHVAVQRHYQTRRPGQIQVQVAAGSGRFIGQASHGFRQKACQIGRHHGLAPFHGGQAG
ncbi:MAG TPA: hypothetical protein DCY05_04290 [Spirochaetaceae bacterium]|nr:hypothetical protein [Spirochaetaceae bacterium]